MAMRRRIHSRQRLFSFCLTIFLVFRLLVGLVMSSKTAATVGMSKNAPIDLSDSHDEEEASPAAAATNTAAAAAGEKRTASATVNGNDECEKGPAAVGDNCNDSIATSSKRQRLVEEISEMKIKAMKNELDRYGVSCTNMLEKYEIIEALVQARLNHQQYATAVTTANSNSNNNNNKNNMIASPIKLLQTNLDRINHSSPLVQEHCLSMRQLLGLDASKATADHQMPSGCRIEWLVISNFMIQFDYLVQEVLPELVSIPKSVIFYECDCSNDNSSTRTQLQRNPNIDVVEISPKAEPRNRTSNNNANSSTSPINPCKYKFPFGTHHTKMFLVGRSNGTLRVIIHTCNIIQGDAAVKAQGAYCQDFPIKTTTTSSSNSSPFEDDLIDYMNTYGYERTHTWGAPATATAAGQGSSRPRTTTLCQELKRFDFSSAKGVLIASTPGYYALDSDEANNRGYLKLSKAIREHCPPNTSASSSSSSFSPIVCQFSSVGSLSEKYLREFCTKLNAGQEPCTNLAKSLKLVFPTPDDIRNSVEGYCGGGTVPSKKTNVYKPFLKPLWHRWTSSLSVSSPTTWPLLKPQNVPHIKTYYQLMGHDGDDSGGGGNDESSCMQWFLLTSHNLSKAAWGEIRKNDRGTHLYVPSWELGVFVAPSMFETKEDKAAGKTVKMVSISATAAAAAAATGGDTSAATTRTVGIPIPYAINPTKYTPTDQPFSWEESYPLPDRFGRKGVRG